MALTEGNKSQDQEVLNRNVNGSALHLNGLQIKPFDRPARNDSRVFEIVFPETDGGKLLQGLLATYLSKQEHRIGWARKSAFSDTFLSKHPNESVAAHQWGVATLVTTLASHPKFQEELPGFDVLKATKMALFHDVAEIVTGDITPVDGVPPDVKHQLEREAMKKILSFFPDVVSRDLNSIYSGYEDRICIESKLVKDCDRLDFIIHAFLLERQGFTGFSEFYPNSIREGFHTKLVEELANTVVETRNELFEKNVLYCKDS